MNRKVIAAVALMLSLLVVGAAFGSNMGFKKSFSFPAATPPNHTFWISLPFFYTPADAGAGTIAPFAGVTDAADLAADLDPSGTVIEIVYRWNPTVGGLEIWQVPQTSPSGLFTLDQGVGYGIKRSATGVDPLVSVVVGSHNNSYTAAYSTSTLPPNRVKWLSIPYHFKATDAGAGTIPPFDGVPDAADLAAQLGGETVVDLVYRWNPTIGGLEIWQTAQTSPSGLFTIDIGTSYGIHVLAGQTATYAPGHY